MSTQTVIPDEELAELNYLVEQDICLAGFEYVERTVVVEKGKEKLSMYDGEVNGASFFHTVGNKTWHVRVQEAML